MMKTGRMQAKGSSKGDDLGVKGSTYLYGSRQLRQEETLRRKLLALLQLHLNRTPGDLQQGQAR